MDDDVAAAAGETADAANVNDCDVADCELSDVTRLLLWLLQLLLVDDDDDVAVVMLLAVVLCANADAAAESDDTDDDALGFVTGTEPPPLLVALGVALGGADGSSLRRSAISRSRRTSVSLASIRLKRLEFQEIGYRISIDGFVHAKTCN